MVVELVFSAMHGERFQTCETKVFKNIVAKNFLLKFPMRNRFKYSVCNTADWFAYIMVAKIAFDFPKNSDNDQIGY